MCGALRAEDANSEAVVAGWVARKRDHGGVIFFDLRDREGPVQVVAHPEESPVALRVSEALKLESVVRVGGRVRERPQGTVNPALATGEIEVVADEIQVLAESETPPFP